MKMNTRLSLVVGMLALAGAGCSKMVRQPEVTLAGVKIGGIGLRGGTIVAEIDIKNPNSFEIESDSITYVFEVAQSGENTAWSPFTQGSYTQRLRVDDGDVTRVEIPIEFNYSAFSGALRSIMDRGTFNYRVTGRVFVREPLERTIPFSKSGNLSLAGSR